MGFLQTVETDFKGALAAAWQALEGPIKSLDATLAGQIATAASVFLQNPTALGLQQCIASVMGALASDAQVAEKDVAAAILAFAAAIENDLTATTTAAQSNGS